MDNKIIFIITSILLVAPAKLYGQKNLLPIDSLYMNSIEKFYDFAEEQVDEIWPGMELSPIVLYRVNGPAFLYNYPEPPEFFTAISENFYLGSQNELQLYRDTIT